MMVKPAEKLTILVSGMIAGDPHQGGATWAVLQYLLGFKRLGHRVLFVEPVQQRSLQPTGVDIGSSLNAEYFRSVTREFDLESTAALLLADSQQTVGMSYHALLGVAQQADVLVNISGMLVDEQLTGRIPVRVYLDLDPAFNQLWQASQNIDMRFKGHTHFVTIGLAIGDEDCPVPTCGLPWITTVQPLIVDYWPAAGQITLDAWTTVGNWRGYGSIDYQGTFYGQKAHSLREFITLPTRTDERFTLAMAIHPRETKDLAALSNHRWELLEPAKVASTPDKYQQFIQGSKGEFGIAKSGYAASRCGWFSDRSICYLASGRPVIAQETGFSRFLPAGQGLFAFQTIEDVLSALELIRRDYVRQSSAAREIAIECFDSDQVLNRLLANVAGV